jgi:hypothetical protein
MSKKSEHFERRSKGVLTDEWGQVNARSKKGEGGILGMVGRTGVVNSGAVRHGGKSQI